MMTAVIMGIPVFGDEGGRRPEPFQVAMATKTDDPAPARTGTPASSTDAAKSASGNAGKGQVDPEAGKYAWLRRCMVETQLRAP